MQVKFTKMHGAGNDFVVLDATRAPHRSSRGSQLRHLGDRRLGVGADQILIVEPAVAAPMPTSVTASSTTRATRSSTAATARAASCASCTTMASPRRTVRVETVNNLLAAAAAARRPRDGGHEQADVRTGSVCPSMPPACSPRREGGFELWPLELGPKAAVSQVAVLSMGNPHAVQRVTDVREAPVAELGPAHRAARALSAQGQCRLPAGAGPQPGGAARIRT
jgi:diaminopimelate epimerase